MSPPKSLRESPLANAGGFVEVDQHTMQSTKYDNVFGLGDAISAPAAKTAAAIFSQTPALIHNLNQVRNGVTPSAKYQGYGSCPMFTGDGKLMLIEF